VETLLAKVIDIRNPGTSHEDLVGAVFIS
jgi:hypothetical protein